MPGGNVDLSAHTFQRDHLIKELGQKTLPHYMVLTSVRVCCIEVCFQAKATEEMLFGEKEIPNMEIMIYPEHTVAYVMGSIMRHMVHHTFYAGVDNGRKKAHKDIIKKLGMDLEELIPAVLKTKN